MKQEYNEDKQKDSPPSECKCKDIPRNSSVYSDVSILLIQKGTLSLGNSKLLTILFSGEIMKSSGLCELCLGEEGFGLSFTSILSIPFLLLLLTPSEM